MNAQESINSTEFGISKYSKFMHSSNAELSIVFKFSGRLIVFKLMHFLKHSSSNTSMLEGNLIDYNILQL